jgi:alpha-N-arabinofuranosidase
MDGPWQIGNKTAAEYGRIAREAAKAMRLVDPTIELVACGSSSHAMPTFGTWEATVLAETYDVVDYVSMHAYYQEFDGDRDSFLGSAVDADRFIEDVVATADHARAVGRHAKRLHISFDEWNVWYQSRFVGEENLQFEHAPRLLEDVYSLTDAVVVGTLLNSLLRHADRVKIACLAQLVNVIAPIMTEPGGAVWRQSTYHPFALTARYGRGTVLHLDPRGPVHGTARWDAVPLLDAVAVHDEETDALTVFAVNRDRHQPMAVNLDLRGVPGQAAGEHVTLAGDDPDAVNDAQHPDRVAPRTLDEVKVDAGRTQVVLPPLSWNMLRFAPTP